MHDWHVSLLLAMSVCLQTGWRVSSRKLNAKQPKVNQAVCGVSLCCSGGEPVKRGGAGAAAAGGRFQMGSSQQPQELTREQQLADIEVGGWGHDVWQCFTWAELACGRFMPCSTTLYAIVWCSCRCAASRALCYSARLPTRQQSIRTVTCDISLSPAVLSVS
jgi:hypothetical protein